MKIILQIGPQGRLFSVPDSEVKQHSDGSIVIKSLPAAAREEAKWAESIERDAVAQGAWEPGMRCACPCNRVLKRPGAPMEPCDECGIGQYLAWTAPDDLWERVVGDPHKILCPTCFSDMCAKCGLRPSWRATGLSKDDDERARDAEFKGYGEYWHLLGEITAQQIADSIEAKEREMQEALSGKTP